MRFNRAAQAAILFCMYLKTHGLSKIASASADLNISTHYLEQLAGKLKDQELITPVRGPGGGYRMDKEVTIGEIFHAIGALNVIDGQDFESLTNSPNELARALGGYVLATSVQLAKLQKLTISELYDQQIVTEEFKMDKADLLSSVSQ